MFPPMDWSDGGVLMGTLRMGVGMGTMELLLAPLQIPQIGLGIRILPFFLMAIIVIFRFPR
jgi:hypothetical protein